MHRNYQPIHIIKTILYGLLSAIVMVQIFSFSAQTGESSSSMSDSIALWILELPILNYQNIDQASQLDLFDMTTFTIRKFAHMSEYAILSISVGAFLSNLRQIFKGKSEGSTKLTTVITAVVFCILYACTDELHQTFIDGRSGQAVDVLIDSVGIVTGALMYALVLRLSTNRHQR